ncbi:deoxyribonuclease IV [Candidatus Dojkabacteria bacterium]|jgi:deoxyribonuclease-4|nr:deoxyribonuclease IV [Candidatus Dojkabacteria bacterium]
MRYLGAHVSINNGVDMAQSAGINSIQIMPSAPIRWISKEIPDDLVSSLAEQLNNSDIKKVLIHGIYLINLARKDKQMFHLSKLSLVIYLNFAAKLQEKVNKDIEVLGVTFHPGSAIDLTPEEGLARISYGLNWIIDNSNGEIPILLESSAGAGNIMGDTFEELASMRSGVVKKDRVGYVIDTQHTFVSGYDWVNNLEGVVSEVDKILGISNVKCFHLNDSATEMGSHKDRHANLGEGSIGKEGIKKIVNNPKLKDIPFILETPALGDLDGIKKEFDTLKSYII